MSESFTTVTGTASLFPAEFGGSASVIAGQDLEAALLAAQTQLASAPNGNSLLTFLPTGGKSSLSLGDFGANLLLYSGSGLFASLASTQTLAGLATPAGPDPAANDTNVSFGVGSNKTHDGLSTNKYNTAIGFGALNTTGNTGGHTAIGYRALNSQNGGSAGGNTAVGSYAGFCATSGQQLVMIGSNAGFHITTGTGSIAIGHGAQAGADVGAVANTGSQNIAIGQTSLQNLTTGYGNIAIGGSAGIFVIDGSQNVLIGDSIGLNQTSPGQGSLTHATQNVIIGASAMYYGDVSSNQNVIIGYQAALGGATAGSTTSIGANSMYNLHTGIGNVAFGNSALWGNHAGCYNTGIGPATLYNNDGTVDGLSGSHNIALGWQAQSNGSWQKTITIGDSSSAGNNGITIGHQNTPTSPNTITIGDPSHTSLVVGGPATATTLGVLGASQLLMGAQGSAGLLSLFNGAASNSIYYANGAGGAPWVANYNYTAQNWVLPTPANGFVYVSNPEKSGGASLSGPSGSTQPVWPTTPGSTVVDGGVTWHILQRLYLGAPLDGLVVSSGTSGVLSINNTTTALQWTASGVTVPGTLTVSGLMTAAVFSTTLTTPTYASSLALNLSTASNFKVTLTGNMTLTNPSAMTVGSQGQIVLVQDGTGNRTITFGSEWLFPGGVRPALSTAAGAIDVLYFSVISSTQILCTAQFAYA